MRIISGTHKGRRISPPKNLPVRPTTDIAKEALFNILRNRFYFDEIKVLDLFSGTGSITYEFLSRGVEDITDVDINSRCTDFIQKISDEFGFEGLKVIRANVFQFIKMTRQKYDLIFADPPYDLEGIDLIPQIIFEKEILNNGGQLIIEHSRDYNFSTFEYFLENRRYGKVNFSIFKMPEED